MQELLDRLESTLDDLRWAIAQVPADREGRRPPTGAGGLVGPADPLSPLVL